MPDAKCIVPLRQPCSSGVANQFAVKIFRGRILQRAHQQELPRRRLQQIRAPHDFRDSHRRVVNHNRELVSRNIVAAPDEKISEIEILSRDVALPAKIQIRKLDRLTVQDPKPPVHARGFRELTDILALTTSSGIHRLIISIIRSARRLRQILARARTRIHEAALPQPPPSLQIVRPALTLGVGSISSSTVRPLTPANSEPVQIVKHGIGEFPSRALWIEILIP